MQRSETQIIVNVPPKLKAQLALQAKRELISLSALVRRYLANGTFEGVRKKQA